MKFDGGVRRPSAAAGIRQIPGDPHGQPDPAPHLELEALIAEQARDDTPFQRQERWLEGRSVPLDAPLEEGTLAAVIGVEYAELGADETRVVDFLQRPRGSVLTEGATYHGTLDGYNNHRCRCPRCRGANAERSRRRYAAQKAVA